MAEFPFDRMESHADRPVPDIEPTFADRLETELRIEHAQSRQNVRPRLSTWRIGWGVVAAAMLGIAALVGVAQFSGDEPAQPLQVTDEGAVDSSIADGADDESSGEDSIEDNAVVVAEPTATSTPAGPTPSATPTPGGDGPVPPQATQTADQSDAALATPTVIQTLQPTATAVPSDRPAPTPTRPAPTATAQPTPRPQPTPTTAPRPTPLPTTTPLPVATPLPTVTPTPTPTREPAPMSLTCEGRIVGDSAGVICTWTAPSGVDVDRYVVFRSRNGGETEVVATQRAVAERTFIDRNMSPGDVGTYLVRGLLGDTVAAASVRVNVTVPSR